MHCVTVQPIPKVRRPSNKSDKANHEIAANRQGSRVGTCASVLNTACPVRVSLVCGVPQHAIGKNRRLQGYSVAERKTIRDALRDEASYVVIPREQWR